MTKITINTTEYQSAHVKKPRGHGAWAFFLTEDGEPLFFTGTYTEALQQAKNMARERFPDTSFASVHNPQHRRTSMNAIVLDLFTNRSPHHGLPAPGRHRPATAPAVGRHGRASTAWP